MSAEIAGRLKSVKVEEGDRVRRGQVLAVLNNDEVHSRDSRDHIQILRRRASIETRKIE